MNLIDDERGVALLAVLGIVLAVLPLAAAIGVQTHLDGLMQRNFRGSAAAFYAAEAGLAHALSEIGPLADLDEILHGPDGVDDTFDDGMFPFHTAAPAAFTRGSVAYEVTASRGPADTIRLYSQGRGHHDSVRAVEALIRPIDTPYTPAALYVEAPDVDIDLGNRGFLVSGILAQNNNAGMAGLSLSSASAAARLRQTLAPATQVAGAGGSPSVAAVGAVNVDSYAGALRRRLDAVFSADSGNTALGTESRPQLTIIDSDWTVGNAVEGFGILVVRGDLQVNGSLHYGGLVLVGGNLSVAETGDVRIDGSLWIHTSGTAAIGLHGTGFIRYGAAALERTDAIVTHALLHLAAVVGWREVF